MLTLDQLRKKWFLDFNSQPVDSPPVRRHDGSNVSAYTDENSVEPLIDGQNYMKVWHDSIKKMISNPSNCELYHSAWRIEGTKTLGESDPTSDALEMINNAQNSGVKVYLPASMHIGAIRYNRPSVIWLRVHGVWTACLDNRFPVRGSNHFKYTCLKNPNDVKAILGSIDISKSRWDTNSHAPKDPNRPEGPTHDVGVMIQGSAVADIEKSFRDRWNDSSRTLGLRPLLPSLPKISTPVSNPARKGSHSIQVLHTYGITVTRGGYVGYSWSPKGEFTIWASYLNAIKKAKTYIYIEDQYFYPFDWPVCHTRKGTLAQRTDLIYQLGEAIARGVKVAVLVPLKTEDPMRKYQKYQRDIGVNYLANLAKSSLGGDFVIAYLHNGTSEIYVHSKLMIVDDEFVLVGSANFGQRSMTCDGEMQIGIVDANNVFARNLRKKLWEEHLQASVSNDPKDAYKLYKERTSDSLGRVRPYPTNHPGPVPIGHEKIMLELIDLYAGPPNLR